MTARLCAECGRSIPSARRANATGCSVKCSARISGRKAYLSRREHYIAAAAKWRDGHRDRANELSRRKRKTTEGRAKRARQMRLWRERNPEATAAKQQASRLRNLASRMEYERRRRSEDVEGTRRMRRESAARHPHTGRRRQIAKLKAEPRWLTRDQASAIEAVYLEASSLTKRVGVRHEVDHIVPLQGKTVCGLHVPWNLQILTKSENSRKGNRLQEPELIRGMMGQSA